MRVRSSFASPPLNLEHRKADLVQERRPVDERNPKIIGTLGREEMNNIDPLARRE